MSNKPGWARLLEQSAKAMKTWYAVKDRANDDNDKSRALSKLGKLASRATKN